VKRDREPAVALGRARRKPARPRTLVTERSNDIVIELSQSEAEPRGGFTDEVIGALFNLPAAEKEVVDLRFLRGMDVDAIAVHLGISEWMVRRRLQLAVARLRLDSLHR